ncbi:lipase family protein [Polymorphospora lycopeni]|uniref:Lipase family protein n=1 Tax=Polymorphospora lycopeni TaxID=3140240 RepID=A0ABV5CQM3_9ACTN
MGESSLRHRLARRTRFLPRIAARLPWWVSALVGLGAAGLGLLLMTRPLSAVGVLAVYVGLSCLASGVADLTAHRRDGPVPAPSAALGLGWIVLGVAVLVWVGTAVELLPRVVAVALLVSGAVKCLQAWRGTPDERLAAVLFGAADIGFGVLALAWPDVTLLVVAVLFGARTVLFGLAQVWAAVGRRVGRAGPARPGRAATGVRRWSRSIGAGLAAAAALAALVITGRIDAGSPVVDGFYTAPDDRPDRPGVLLRHEPFGRDVPADAKAWRILYTTTRDDGVPAVASGLVVAPAAPATTPRPVIAWAHGTTGYAANCAPSLLPSPFTAGALPALDRILGPGRVLVATDYTGLGTAGPQPYLIGQGEARAVLDAVRAARQLDQLRLAAETVVWGHSQGGHAALWTAQIQPTYAPDVPLSGVAAMAPAADTLALTRHLPQVRGGSVFASFVIEAYARTYPDVDLDDYVIPSARILVREMATRCLAEPGLFVSVLDALSIDRDRPIYARDPTGGSLGRRLAQNTPTGPFEMPVLLAQGASDPLVTLAIQDGYVAGLAAAGQRVDYRTYAGRDHMGLVAADSPLISDLVTWTGRLLHP